MIKEQQRLESIEIWENFINKRTQYLIVTKDDVDLEIWTGFIKLFEHIRTFPIPPNKLHNITQLNVFFVVACELYETMLIENENKNQDELILKLESSLRSQANREIDRKLKRILLIFAP